ncbi:MAG: outer membrane beta-barrel protein [Saprospiraceae bacterium]
MKKAQLVIVFLLCTLCYNNTLTAQLFTEYKPNSIDLIVGVEYGHRLLYNQSGSENEESIIDFRNNKDKGKTNYRLGFNYNIQLKRKLYLKTGIRYVHAGYKTRSPFYTNYEQATEILEKDFQPHSGSYFQQIYQMLEFPLAIRYVYSENWCKSYIEAGLSANHHLQTKFIGKTEDGERQQIVWDENINSWNLSSAIAIGAEFLIRRELPAFIQMTARYQITSLSESVGERLIAMGIESGVRYEF